MNLLLITGILVLGGIVKGLNGFGYAVVSTTLLSTVMPAQKAVALMIVPLMLSNIELLREVTLDELQICVERFKSYIITAVTGVVAGTLAISITPQTVLSQIIGLFTLLFVASRINYFSRIFRTGLSYCVENSRIELFLGFISGLVFGSTNIGIPFVAYFRRIGLEKKKFASMIALTVLLSSAIRIPLAAQLGLYSDIRNILLSIILAAPGLAGVKVGKEVRKRVPEEYFYKASLLLMLVIGIKLLGTF